MTWHRDITDRQREIIELLAKTGARQQTVADELGIELSTVRTHLGLAYRTLGVSSLDEAVAALKKRTSVPTG